MSEKNGVFMELSNYLFSLSSVSNCGRRAGAALHSMKDSIQTKVQNAPADFQKKMNWAFQKISAPFQKAPVENVEPMTSDVQVLTPDPEAMQEPSPTRLSKILKTVGNHPLVWKATAVGAGLVGLAALVRLYGTVHPNSLSLTLTDKNNKDESLFLHLTDKSGTADSPFLTLTGRKETAAFNESLLEFCPSDNYPVSDLGETELVRQPAPELNSTLEETDSDLAAVVVIDKIIGEEILPSVVQAPVEELSTGLEETALQEVVIDLSETSRETGSAIQDPGLDSNLYINSPDENGVTPLHRASKEGDAGSIRLLLNGGADINSVDQNNWTPLIYACHKNHTKAAELLLEEGADIHAKTKNGGVALHFASENGNAQVVRWLLEKGADVNAVFDLSGDNSLHGAADKQHPEVVRLLVDAGADVDKKNKIGWTPIQYVTCKMKWSPRNPHLKEIADLLRNKGATLTWGDQIVLHSFYYMPNKS